MMTRQEVTNHLEECTDIWKSLCELHNLLFEKTCDEYLALLASDLNQVEAIIAEKEVILQNVANTDQLRIEQLAQINRTQADVNHFSDLIRYYREQQLDPIHLEKFNLLLIDIIEKITAQNKKNQLFLNKAIQSLSDLKSNFKGQTQYKLYNKAGNVTTKNV